ncbi:hemolysin III family protein, partial [Schumannella luteola]
MTAAPAPTDNPSDAAGGELPGSPTADEARAEAEPAAGLPNLPFLEDELDHPPVETKPLWRGWIHAGTFPLAIAAGIVLICLADGAAAKWASAVFMASSLLLFGISATYHRFNWSPKVK